jgi:hypothetical protein
MKPRDNPFRAARISSLPYRFPRELSWTALFNRLQRLHYRGALVGPEGSGKTTLLEEMDRRLTNAGFTTRLLSARSGLAHQTLGPASCRGVFLLIDSAERLNWFQWRLLRWHARRAAGLVVTLHVTARMPTLYDCRTTPELFRELVHELLPAGYQAFPGCGDLVPLFHKHRGNIRSALRELYDIFSTVPLLKPEAGQPVQLLAIVGN